MNKRKLYSSSDLIIIVILLILAIVIYFAYNLFHNNEGSLIFAEISLYGETVKTLSLDEDLQFSVQEVPAVSFEIYQGMIRFHSADCLDQICVNRGFMSRSGQIAACLPNGLTLRLFSHNTDVDEPDLIV